jgi:hypothetical protein
MHGPDAFPLGVLGRGAQCWDPKPMWCLEVVNASPFLRPHISSSFVSQWHAGVRAVHQTDRFEVAMSCL